MEVKKSKKIKKKHTVMGEIRGLKQTTKKSVKLKKLIIPTTRASEEKY